jgi:hypothetical protein
MSTDPTYNENGGAYDYSNNNQGGGGRGAVDGRQQRDDDHMEEYVMSDDMSGTSATPLINDDGRSGKISRNSRSAHKRAGGSSPHVQKIFSAVKDSVRGDRSDSKYKQAMDPLSPTSLGGEHMFPPKPVVLPPACSVRSRCYRLNLNAPISLTLPSATGNDKILGPYACSDAAAQGDRAVDANPAYVGFSPTLDDLTTDDYDKTLTISTARIFRGLRIEPDGQVTSMHHRNKGAGPKRDEKSRQSAKIDKAVDMVDDQVKKGYMPPPPKESNEDNEKEEGMKMVSIVFFGEYDDMKSLVRDGARRLKDNQTILDDALWAMNKQRMERRTSYRSPMNSESSWYGGGSGMDVSSRHSGSRGGNNKMPNSAPPKLHRHPRDRPGSSTRREIAQNASRNNSSKGGKRFPPWRKNDEEMFGGESDWSDALQFSKGLYSMCVCGANSVSPTSGTGYYEQNGKNNGTNAPPQMTNEGREPTGGGGGNQYGNSKSGNRYSGTADGRDGAYSGAKETILV